MLITKRFSAVDTLWDRVKLLYPKLKTLQVLEKLADYKVFNVPRAVVYESVAVVNCFK